MDDAHAMLESAQRVCFIGFGYDPVSLERLKWIRVLEECPSVLE